MRIGKREGWSIGIGDIKIDKIGIKIQYLGKCR